MSPTQNAPCERAGGAWKYRARRQVDQFSIKWNAFSTKLWLCAVLNWSTNTAIGVDTVQVNGVLGRSLRLPFQLLSRASQLASHQRHRDDVAYQRRVAMLAEAQRSIISTVLSCPGLEVPIILRHRFVLQSETSHVLAWEQQAKESVVNALVGSRNCHGA